MIQVKIREAHELNPSTEPLGRRYLGFDEGKTRDELYEAARGTWPLDMQPAKRERYVAVASGGKIRLIFEFDQISPRARPGNGRPRAATTRRRCTTGSGRSAASPTSSTGSTQCAATGQR